MIAILPLIEKTWSDRQEAHARATVARDWAMPWLYATRLHALLDCYEALGGDVSLWRKKSGRLK